MFPSVVAVLDEDLEIGMKVCINGRRQGSRNLEISCIPNNFIPVRYSGKPDQNFILYIPLPHRVLDNNVFHLQLLWVLDLKKVTDEEIDSCPKLQELIRRFLTCQWRDGNRPKSQGSPTETILLDLMTVLRKSGSGNTCSGQVPDLLIQLFQLLRKGCSIMVLDTLDLS